MKTQWQILVVDDEEVMRESLAAWLAEDGYGVDTAASGRDAIEHARRKDYAIYFIDLKMPGGIDGIETMMEIRRLHADASIIIITAYATVDTAITAMKEGAQDYIVKPCNPEEISLLVNRIIKVKNLQRENTILRKKLSRQYHFGDIVSKNARMQEIFALAADIANLRSTALIQGESGTGKECRAPHWPKRCLNPSSSDTRRDRSRAPARRRKASSKWRMGARCFWMRSATFLRSCRWICCASCRRKRFTVLAGRRKSGSTCA